MKCVHERVSRKSLAFLVSAILLTLAVPAAAATITGSTGLLTVPAAGVLPQGAIDGGVRYVDGALSASVAFGALQNVEVGVNNVSQNGEPDQLGFVVKGLIFAETDREPGVAVGFEPGRAYVVMSKRLAPRLRAHVGYGHGDVAGLFGAASYTLTTASPGGSAVRMPATTAMVEYTPNGVNLGARMVFSPAISVDVGLLDMEEVVVGVSYRTAF